MAFMALGGLLYGKMVANKEPILIQATLCPSDGPHSITVVLIDTTDELSDVAKSELRIRLKDVATAIPRYGLLELRKLSPNKPGGQVLFSKCNPGDGSDQNELTGNPLLKKKKWVEGFETPLESELLNSLQDDKANFSPIMATIQRIAIEKFSGNSVADIPKKLIIVSDMIEHGPEYSQYKGDLHYQRYRNSLAYRKFRTDLHGASIAVEYIQRNTKNPLSPVDHIKFWEEWVKDNNGHVIAAHKIQGLQ